ncbi:MAG: hypothetical protein IJZ03_07980 [Clostridia bacterium]|nr:hypothetical protein [Clostridia bacterium]
MKKFLFLMFTILICVCLLSSCNHTVSNNEEPKLQENNTTESTPDHSESTQIYSSMIFNTDNIKRITFYSYYGQGKGSDVTDKDMTEIINWLETFEIDREADDLIPPGTNTNYIEIEYLDGKVVKKGLDVMEIDGSSYYVKSAPMPDCFWEIISKTKLN